MRGVIYARRGQLGKDQRGCWGRCQQWELTAALVAATRGNYNHYSGGVKGHHGTQIEGETLNQHFFEGEGTIFIHIILVFLFQIKVFCVLLMMDAGYLLKGSSGMPPCFMQVSRKKKGFCPLITITLLEQDYSGRMANNLNMSERFYSQSRWQRWLKKIYRK